MYCIGVETGTYVHNSCISKARPIKSPEYKLRIHRTSRSAQKAHSKSKAMTCLRIFLIDVEGSLFLSKSESKALLPGFLPIYRMRFEPLRVPCRLEHTVSIPVLRNTFCRLWLIQLDILLRNYVQPSRGVSHLEQQQPSWRYAPRVRASTR